MKNAILCFGLLLIVNPLLKSQPIVKHVKKGMVESINLDIKNAKKSVSSNSIFDRIEFIKLETGKDFLLGNISKVIAVDEKLFVLSSSNSIVYCFSRDGEYLFTLNKKGLGPRETGEVSDMEVDLNSSRIILSDSQKRNLYFYTINGKFVKRIRLKHWVYDLSLLNPDLLVIRTSESGGADLKLYDLKKEEVVSEAIKLYPLEDICQGYNMLSTFQNTVLFTPTVRDTIYEVNEKNIKAKYKINFGKHAVPKEKMQSNSRVAYMLYNNDRYNYAGMVSNAWESEKHIGFSYKYSKSSDDTQVLFCKQSGKANQFRNIVFNGIFIPVKSKLFRSSKNFNYGIIDPVTITSQLQSKGLPYGRFMSLEEVISKTSVDDNSIIAIYSLKPSY